MKWAYPAGSTPLDPDEIAGLKIKGLMYQSELDIEEAMNIAEAAFWLEGKVSKLPLEASFLSTLHREMFGRVWRWAGQYRLSDKNLGVHWINISQSLEMHLGNVHAQLIANRSKRDVATFYHHGLVYIHPFPNGNGRWARMATEVFCDEIGLIQPSWIKVRSDTHFQYREQYIAALKRADGGDFDNLKNLMFEGLMT